MDSKEVLAENSKLFGENLPEVAKGFTELCQNIIFKDGNLSLKQKELIALAIAITVKCDGCIFHHAKACVDAGCTMEEISEMMEVCVAMGGGPATVYSGKALRIVKENIR